MKYMVSTLKSTPTPYRTKITWNFLVFKHNEHEVEIAKKIASSIGVYFNIGKMRTSMKDEILKPHKESILKDKHWIPDNPDYSAYDKEKSCTKKVIKTCKKPWQEISINWDGNIFPCCAVYGDEFSFGNCQNISIKEIWNNSFYRTARKEILINNKSHPRSICGICKHNGFLHM